MLVALVVVGAGVAEVVLGPLPAEYVTFGTVLAELSNKMTELLIYTLVSESSGKSDHGVSVPSGRQDH